MKIKQNNKIIFLIISTVFLSIFFSKVALAAWNGLPYNPGATDNPECMPSQANCDVLPAITTESDPLSVHTDQTTPQTFSAGTVAGSGLLKVVSGQLGLDTSTYVTGTPWTAMGYAPIDSPTFTGTVSGITSAMVGAPSGSGTSTGTNTGDNAANNNYANDYRLANFIAGTNYLAPNGSAALLTNFPTLNQNTTGNAATATTATTANTANTATTLTGLTSTIANLNTLISPLGSAAFTASTAYQPAGSYLTSLLGAALLDQTTPQTIGTNTNRLAQLFTTDLSVTNPITGSVTGNAGTVTNGVYTTDAGTVFLSPNGSAAALTSFPTFNQNTTGSAATLTTPRTIAGVSFNGSANISIPSTGLSDTANIAYLNAANAFTNVGNTSFAGNVGIGTTGPAALLSIGATSQFQVNSSGVVSATNLSGTNTGDNAANNNYANDYRLANFVAGTSYQSPITLTTTGASGAATLGSNTLNVPNYTLVGLGGQPLNTNLTSIGGVANAAGALINNGSGTFSYGTPWTGLSYITSSSLTPYALLSGSIFSGVISATNLSGTNTGDNAINSNYASDFRATNFVAGTNYQAPITLTTTGSSGAATFIGNTLNIPNYAGTTYTFSTGLTNSSGTITNNLLTGIAGNQTVIGSTTANGILTIEGNNTTGNTMTSPNLDFNVGNNGSMNAMTILNNGNVGIGTTTPTGLFQITQGTAGIGTVAVAGTAVTGTDTQFTNTFKNGDSITVTTTSGSETKAITAVTSDTVLATSAFTGTASAGTAYTLTGGTAFSVFGNGNASFTDGTLTLSNNAAPTGSVVLFAPVHNNSNIKLGDLYLQGGGGGAGSSGISYSNGNNYDSGSGGSLKISPSTHNKNAGVIFGYSDSFNGFSLTSGTQNAVSISNPIFNPASGNALFNTFQITNTINQTSTANGITRGIYINPTLTNAADFRALETSPYTFNLAASYAGGALYSTVLNAPTIAGSFTVPNASTLYISGAPIQGTGATLTNTSALVVASGNVGIGTTSPSALLSVGATSQFQVDTSGNTTVAALKLSNVASGTQCLQADASGNITGTGSACGSGGGTTYTFSTGLTNTSGTITNNLSVGVSGGQTVIGGTGVTDILNLKGTTGNGTLTSAAIQMLVGNNGAMNALTILNNGNIGIGAAAPTAILHLSASSGAVNDAPLKFTSGALLGTTEAGAIEYDGSHIYFTATNAGTRYQLDQQSAASGITIGTSAITGGTTGSILYNNGTVLGEMTTSGSGTVVALQNSPALLSPTISDSGAPTKTLAFSLSGMTSAKTLTLSSAQTTSQTLTIPNITGADTLATLALAQTFTGAKTFNNASVLAGAATMALFNTTATTITTMGAATTLTIGGTPTTAITHNYSTNATANAVTKTINFATGGASGSTTAINIGSITSGAIDNINIGTSAAANILTIGSATASSTLTLRGGTAGAITITNLGTGTIQATAGVLSLVSDERLKNISGQYTKGLAALAGINPINYEWNATSGLPMGITMTGFSAQNVQANIPEAVSVGDNGYLGLNDRAILATTVNAIKELNLNLEGAAGTVAPVPGSGTDTFVIAFFKNVEKTLVAWLGSATNGIGDMFANTFNAKQKICVDGECLTKNDIHNLLLLSHPNIGTSASAPDPVSIPITLPTTITTATSTIPAEPTTTPAFETATNTTP